MGCSQSRSIEETQNVTRQQAQKAEVLAAISKATVEAREQCIQRGEAFFARTQGGYQVVRGLSDQPSCDQKRAN